MRDDLHASHFFGVGNQFIDGSGNGLRCLLGYALTVLIETRVLLIGLSPRHSTSLRLGCGLWLTACTYPIVVLVFPLLIWDAFGEGWYILVAETFALLAECILFRQLLRSRPQNLQATRRDYAVITAANLASFLTGEYLF